MNLAFFVNFINEDLSKFPCLFEDWQGYELCMTCLVNVLPTYLSGMSTSSKVLLSDRLLDPVNFMLVPEKERKNFLYFGKQLAYQYTVMISYIGYFMTYCGYLIKMILNTVKFLNFQTPKIFAVSYLKFEQRGQTLGYFVKMVQRE